MIDPITPPNPSSRSGFAWTKRRLPNPSDAHTMDQNDGGNVIRRAAAANALPSSESRRESVCQLNVM